MKNSEIHTTDSNSGDTIGSIHYNSYLEYVTFTQEEEHLVIRRIDMFILPLMCLIFFAQYLDKQSLTYAAVFGLETELKMAGHDYS